MVQRKGNVTTEVIKGIQVSIMAPRDNREEMLKVDSEIRESVKKFGGKITAEDQLYEKVNYMVVFPSVALENAWKEKMQFEKA